jgi:hypothetical protein
MVSNELHYALPVSGYPLKGLSSEILKIRLACTYVQLFPILFFIVLVALGLMCMPLKNLLDNNTEQIKKAY